ncbi:hypothetical protein H9L39_17803 [Fusarium oxysporum f. sp. albedinis]|nr:hypothetical protein H9L39_17803 [Fusarium oxysporum f. sp. albedinis]
MATWTGFPSNVLAGSMASSAGIGDAFFDALMDMKHDLIASPSNAFQTGPILHASNSYRAPKQQQ